MKLTFKDQLSANEVYGIQAALLRDDVHGMTLVIQSGHSQMLIKLSDIVKVTDQQRKEEREAAEALD